MLRRSTRERKIKKPYEIIQETIKKRKLSKPTIHEDGSEKKLIEFKQNRKNEYQNSDDSDFSDNGEEFDLSKYQPSQYELLRQQNMKENLQMFDDLNVREAKQSLKPKRIPRVWKKRPAPPQRSSSSRIKNRQQTVDYIFKTVPIVSFSEEQKNKQTELRPEKIDIKKECTEDERRVLSDISNLHHVERKEVIQPEITDFKNFTQKMKSLEVHQVAKIIPSFISSLVVHPIETKLLCFAGDRLGNISLWDLDGAEESHHGIALFGPHSSLVSHMKFSDEDTNKLYSCSYDGTFRCFDLNNLTFTQLYSFSKRKTNRLYHFSNRKDNSSTYYVAAFSGDLFQLDTRTKNLENSFRLYQEKICCVDFHPTNENLFTTSGVNGKLNTWDVRYLRQNFSQPLSECEFSETISACFFSPQSGDKVLTTSLSHTRLFDVNLNGDLTGTFQIRHYDNNAKPFQALWIPNTSNCFIKGSAAIPRQVGMFGFGKRLDDVCVFPITDPRFTSMTYQNVFHPTQNVLFSGNTAGRVYVWR